MKTDEKKKEAMAAFRDRQSDVLIATTVSSRRRMPNATVIVIDNADRFGLSQLHQLEAESAEERKQSFCLLIADPITESARSALERCAARTMVSRSPRWTCS